MSEIRGPQAIAGRVARRFRDVVDFARFQPTRPLLHLIGLSETQDPSIVD